MGKESKQESRQSLTQAFIDRYAPIAMEQQQKYGIPASVTLAQALMESGTGTSRLAQNANNFFGVKCGSGWLAAGKPYMVASDDKPDDKFRVYDDVAQSFEDHSRVLMGSRYMKYCGGLTSVDYENWAKGIKAGGYATSPTYVEGVLKNIKSYNLQEYDQMAVIDARQKGITIGYMRGKDAPAVGSRPSAVIPDTSVQAKVSAAESQNRSQVMHISQYQYPVGLATYCNNGFCMPLRPEKDSKYYGDLVVTSGFGHRASPGKGASTEHTALDLRARVGTPVMATENNGKVITVASDSKSGNYVKVQYDRSDGTSYIVSYAHLDKVNVRKGDVVNAGDVIALSGHTGIQGSGAHLHFKVRHVVTSTVSGGDGRAADGSRDSVIDPTKYLAEIAVRGNLSAPLSQKSGQAHADTMAPYKPMVNLAVQPVSPAGATADLLAQNGDDIQLSEQQRRNAEAGMSRQPSSLFQMLLGSDAAAQMGYTGQESGGFLESLISSLFKYAIMIAVTGRLAGSQSEDLAQNDRQQPCEETPEERAANEKRRESESVKAADIKEQAMLNFDAAYPEQRGQDADRTQQQRYS